MEAVTCEATEIQKALVGARLVDHAEELETLGALARVKKSADEPDEPVRFKKTGIITKDIQSNAAMANLFVTTLIRPDNKAPIVAVLENDVRSELVLVMPDITDKYKTRITRMQTGDYVSIGNFCSSMDINRAAWRIAEDNWLKTPKRITLYEFEKVKLADTPNPLIAIATPISRLPSIEN